MTFQAQYSNFTIVIPIAENWIDCYIIVVKHKTLRYQNVHFGTAAGILTICREVKVMKAKWY